MKKTIEILFLLLFIQIGLSLWLHSKGSNLEAFSTDKKLLGDLSFDSFDEVSISNKEASMLLKKVDDSTWVLPESENFPVSPGRLKNIQEKLLDLKQSYPVAFTNNAAKQFKLSNSDFERKITFKKGESVLKTVYLGTSPGFKKVYTRVEGEDNIYSVQSNTVLFQPKAESWIDKSVYAFKDEEIAKVIIGGLSILTKEPGKYLIQDIPKGQKENINEIRKLVSKATRMEITETLGKKNPLPESSRVLEYIIEKKDGTEVTYNVYKDSKKKEFLVHTSAVPFYSKVSNSFVDPLLGFKKEDLFEKIEAPKEEIESQEMKKNANEKEASPMSEKLPVE